MPHEAEHYKIPRSAYTVYLRVQCVPVYQNKQRLFPHTAVIRFL